VTGDYYGLPTLSISSPHLHLEFLAEAGPRLVRLYLTGSDRNLLAELPNLDRVETPFGSYQFLGGHRLWHGPENLPRTYVPDMDGLSVEEIEGGQAWRLTGALEAPTGIQKEIEIRLEPDRPALTLTHRLHNCGLWAIELAPWAITQLPLGGVAVLPQTTIPLDESGLLPNRQLVLWNDLRLEVDDDYILMRAVPQLPPAKVGYFNRQGWIGYLDHGVLMVKRFQPLPDLPHVDFGSNVECYVNNKFIELETLGPLTRIEPGEAAVHIESWEFIPGLEAQTTLAGMRNLLKTLHLGT
jgi:hypothetical protein